LPSNDPEYDSPLGRPSSPTLKAKFSDEARKDSPLIDIDERSLSEMASTDFVLSAQVSARSTLPTITSAPDMQNAQKVTITYKFTGKPEFLMGEMSMLTP
jgi:hypothetical protein